MFPASTETQGGRGRGGWWLSPCSAHQATVLLGWPAPSFLSSSQCGLLALLPISPQCRSFQCLLLIPLFPFPPISPPISHSLGITGPGWSGGLPLRSLRAPVWCMHPRPARLQPCPLSTEVIHRWSSLPCRQSMNCLKQASTSLPDTVRPGCGNAEGPNTSADSSRSPLLRGNPPGGRPAAPHPGL